jgi:hypothetical protein
MSMCRSTSHSMLLSTPHSMLLSTPHSMLLSSCSSIVAAQLACNGSSVYIRTDDCCAALHCDVLHSCTTLHYCCCPGCKPNKPNNSAAAVMCIERLAMFTRRLFCLQVVAKTPQRDYTEEQLLQP